MVKVCMPTFASFANQAFRTGMLEAQDVLASTTGAHLVPLAARSTLRQREDILGRLIHHDFTKRLAFVNPGIEPIRLDREYDLFVLACPWWRDVLYCNAIENWVDCAKVKVCWIDELWISEIDQLGPWLPLLNRFDYIFIGIDGSGEYLNQRINSRAFDLAGGVDALRFSPVAEQQPRPIDVLSIGRRAPTIHRAIRELTASQNLFYMFDTLQSGNSHALDHAEHRIMYAETLKRSKLFMVSEGKWDVQAQAAGQGATGYRYFEGAAAGAALLGNATKTESFRANFGWEDDVIALRADGSDAAQVMTSLLGDTSRLEMISRRNTCHALRRHDWIYRWIRIFEVCGLEPTPGMLGRVAALERAARRRGSPQC